MNTKQSLDKAEQLIGLKPLADALGGTYQMVRKWQKNGKMPNTEYSGETKYSWIIEELCEGQVTVESLLGFRPPFHDKKAANG